MAERLASHLDALLSGSIDRRSAEAGYRRDHALLRRNGSRVTALALLMNRRPQLARRAVAASSQRTQALERLLGINCGYWGFGRLTARDWATLAGL